MNFTDVRNKLKVIINRAEIMLNNVSYCGSEFTSWNNDVLIVTKRALPVNERKYATFEKYYLIKEVL